MLSERVLPLCQYGAYVEIARTGSQAEDPLAARSSDLWQAYDGVVDEHAHFARRRIARPGDIYPVFRDLFRREGMAA
jgi:uncharacterized sporulation protein YeaH/YhbH (DUF444 family)